MYVTSSYNILSKLLCQADQAGAEALIVAWECDPGKYRDLFLNGIKPHVYLGLPFYQHWEKEYPAIHEIRQLSISDIPKHPDWKRLSKAIKDSDSNPASTRYYYLYKQTCHCVDEETEILTREGWTSVKNYNSAKELAVWSEDRNIFFEIPSSWIVSQYNGDMYTFISDEINQRVTKNHRMVYSSNNKLHITSAERLSTLRNPRIPNSGYYIGGNKHYDENIIKLLVAIQADGNIQTPNQVRFHIGKTRKIERLKDICSKLNLPICLTRDTHHPSNYVVYWIVIKEATEIISMFKDSKVWDNWLLDLSLENLKTLIDELKYWDGTYEEQYLHKREAYFSNNTKNLEWMKTICHLVGKQGTINELTMGINSRQEGRLKHAVKEKYEGKVYCPTVSTGMFLIRRNKKISVTGNSSNYGIEARTFQKNLLEKSDGKVALKLYEAEAYLEIYHSLFPEIRRWNNKIISILRRTHVLRNLFGYPREFTGAIIESMYKEALAFVPQSTVGCITINATIALQDYVEKNNLDWDYLNNKHDSYLWQAPENEIEILAKKMKEFIEQDLISSNGEQFKMKSEVAIGKNWGKYYKKENKDDPKSENLEGLKEIKL